MKVISAACVFSFYVLAVELALGASGLEQSPASTRQSIFDGLAFRNIGPATASGRVDDFAVLESNPAVFYVATATGGLWKTTNNGTTWEVLFDDIEDVVSIGDVAIPRNDANLVWVGTGENNNRNSSSWGKGVYKSTDGGQSWKKMGLADTRHVGRILIDPVNPDIVYVAATGHLWGPNEERGVFKTTDGGLRWSKILFVNEDTGATDLVMDPSDNKVLYAAMYQRRRAAWGFNGGGPGSAIYKSADAGNTWEKLTNGTPDGPIGRIGLDIYRKNSTVVYATIEHDEESGVYRSDDAGASWRKISDLNPRPMYFSQIRVDPNDDHRVYLLGVLLHISDDGGKTFFSNSSMHGDHHAMWIDPSNSNHVLTGSDGGVGISYDRGKTWDFVDNMDLGQLYHVGYDMDSPYRVYGGFQDNESWGGPSAVRNLYGHYHGVGEIRRAGIANGDWFLIGVGDGFVAVADPTDSRTIYNEAQGGSINRVDRESNERKSIKPRPEKGEEPLRWNWNTPMMISPHAPTTLYAAANRVYRSTDRGHSWTAISPDLTAVMDRATLSLMGIPEKDFKIARHDGVSAFGTLVAFAESPKAGGLFYAGADDGTVHVSRDDGTTWTNISDNFSGLPENTPVSRLTPSAFEVGTVYATFDGHQRDDYSTYVYVSTDHGKTWRSIGSNIPKGHVVRCITEDTRNANVLYLGTEFGLFVTLDRGGRWTWLRSNLPTVPIYEITLHPRDNDMILATHGRSIWILDDLTPIQQAAEAMKAEAYLFDLRPATQFFGARERIVEGDRRFWGQNPEFGVAIAYYLNQTGRKVSITVADLAGSLIRTLADPIPNESAFNRAHWDLRHQSLPPPRGYQRPGRVDPLDGPFVLPGEYMVTLTMDGKEIATHSVIVNGDPVMPLEAPERETLHEASMALHAMLGTANEAAEAVSLLGEHLQTIMEMLDQVSDVPGPVQSVVEEVAERIKNLRVRLGLQVPGGPRPRRPAAGNVRNLISVLKGEIMSSTSVPTEMQIRALNEHREDLASVIEEVNVLISTDMPALYETLSDYELRPQLPRPIKRVAALPQ